MNPHPVPPVTVSWQRIDTWLSRHAPACTALLRPPADPADLAAAERVLGRPLPPELRESLGCHDGATGWTTLLPEQSPLGAAGIAEHWRTCTDVAADNDGLAIRPWDDEPWWHPQWLPWAETADGHAHVIDLRPGPARGRLGWAGHSGGGDFTDSWPGLAAYLHAVADALLLGGGVRGTYPYLTADGRLWWDLGADCHELDGGPLTPAPVGAE
ncbi:SMI1/KNR4 family protein [Kitasatospora phosalacinea]|uniref:SMI1/KNR4 family protein n=1 Tax=Kitasatospora phosalacinea TaxID=2065 RepID=UPI002553ABBE|nr:SMI1/KNR4 family protein [Kitasatospora phosalacinea]